MIGTDSPHAGRSQPTRAWLSVAAVALVSCLAVVACGSASTSPASSGGTGGASVASGTGGVAVTNVGVGAGGKAGTGGTGPTTSSGGSTASADAGADSGTVATATPCDATNKVFIPKCAAACHGSVGPFMPDLSSEKAVSSLVGMPQIMKCAADMTSSIVNSSAPLGGTLFLWISGATCRDQMPYGGTPLTADEIACVKSYFAAKVK